MNNKQLRRFPHDSVVGGVASGIADYLGMDKALVRFIFVLLFFFAKGVPVVLVYIVLWVALPKAVSGADALAGNWSYPDTQPARITPERATQYAGYGLLGLGAFLLFDDLFYWINIDRFLPAALLIGLGGYLIWRDSNKKETTTEPTFTAPPQEPAQAEVTKTEPSIFDEPETPTESEPNK
ncbi:MAG: PspC domain-containing protein [Runella slithyformis]|nr:MAG: PspC domain-containing protein [Runella slithyformis]TAF94193.1 MAG: PspC domain-containing protein [Runella sp.]TAG18683.1 MAG: PspC domain-containing protein [Cytophagales bacterium]TAG38233.1 MAG: PspC domain-containing protein [Cytophagia bacterium]TAF23287.1 MAG: PspC domain-containing protein [Runella slithyformis]